MVCFVVVGEGLMIEWFDCDVLFVFIVGEGDIDVSLWLCLLCEFIG